MAAIASKYAPGIALGGHHAITDKPDLFLIEGTHGVVHESRASPAVVPTQASAAANSTGSHLLIVDSDIESTSQLQDYLGKNQFRITTVATVRNALEALVTEAIDLVLLEPQLPDEDGMRLTQTVGATRIPIVVVSRRTEEADRVMALELGADDYLAKPFSSRELLARIRAVLRRRRLESVPLTPDTGVRVYRFGGWELNLGLRSLRAPDGRKVHLTLGEFRLMHAFVSTPNRVLTRAQLLDMTHVHGAEVYDRAIDVQVLRVRRKIEDDCSQPRWIRTEHGIGYCFEATVTVVR